VQVWACPFGPGARRRAPEAAQRLRTRPGTRPDRPHVAGGDHLGLNPASRTLQWEIGRSVNDAHLEPGDAVQKSPSFRALESWLSTVVSNVALAVSETRYTPATRRGAC
jgi:hypothetical protein